MRKAYRSKSGYFSSWSYFDWLSLVIIVSFVVFLTCLFINSDVKSESKYIEVVSVTSNMSNESPGLLVETSDGDTYSLPPGLYLSPNCAYVVKTFGYQIVGITEERGCK